MSLEQALAENTAALNALIGAIKGNAAALAAIAAGTPVAAEPEQPAPKSQAAGKTQSAATTEKPAPTQPTAKVEADAVHEKTADASAQSAEPAAGDAQASTAAAEPQPEYPAAVKAVTDLVKAKGRDTAFAVLKSFGASNLKEVAAEKYSEVIAACEEASA